MHVQQSFGATCMSSSLEMFGTLDVDVGLRGWYRTQDWSSLLYGYAWRCDDI